MGRKSNRTQALEHAARINVVITEEPDGVELWGFNTHMSDDGGAHFGYVNREDFATTPAMWEEVNNWLGQYSECPDDCECRHTHDVTRETGRCGTVPHSDGIAAEFDSYFPACDTCGQWREACACMEVTTCTVCGDSSDYCTGHGEIGDPRGYAILTAHDDDDHSQCHWRADCSPRNYWGTLKTDVSGDHCPLCERENPFHYSICPNHRS